MQREKLGAETRGKKEGKIGEKNTNSEKESR